MHYPKASSIGFNYRQSESTSSPSPTNIPSIWIRFGYYAETDRNNAIVGRAPRHYKVKVKNGKAVDYNWGMTSVK